MLLKIIRRAEKDKHTLFSICRLRWHSSNEEEKLHIMCNYLITLGVLSKLSNIDDFKCEARRDESGKTYWYIHRLSRAKDRFLVFIRINVFSNR